MCFAISRNGTASAPKSNKTSPAKDSQGKQDNPFEEDEWDEESGGALTDTGEPGVPVRALYDYTGAESDELSFRQGELRLRVSYKPTPANRASAKMSYTLKWTRNFSSILDKLNYVRPLHHHHHCQP